MRSELISHPSSLIPWYSRAGFDIQEFSAGGIRTFAVVEGPRTHFPAVFLHGVPGGAFLWEYIIAALGRKRLAVAPDFPGWGRSVSRHQPLPTPTLEWSLNWLNQVLAAQDIERFDLIAHGNSGWLALELLAKHPERVRRLGLISPRLWAGQRERPRLGRLFGRQDTWSEVRLREWLDSRAAMSFGTRERSAQEFAQQSRYYPPVQDERPYLERFENYRRVLTHYRGATQLIWGENDPAYSLQPSEDLVSGLDRPDVHRIANAGYFPMLDRPQEVTPILKEFLAD